MKTETTQYIDAALALHHLALNEARRNEVEKQFMLLQSMFTLIETEPLPIEVESANTFRL
jgi:hypothetical protein